MNPPSAPAVSASRGIYAVAILTLAYAASFVDRQILSLLADPVKADLVLSDVQLGLLHGFAFAIFYTLTGIPIARAADRHDRRRIIVAGVVLWSVMTALCGFARSFTALFGARIGVGVGEAALSPAAFSIIADLVPRDRLATALSVYNMGVFIGSGLAFMAGGALVASIGSMDLSLLASIGLDRPWRVIFVMVGLPGLLIAALLAGVPEPARQRPLPPEQATLRAALRFLGSRRHVLGALFLGFSLHASTLYAVMAWAPVGIARGFGMPVSTVGLWLGVGVLGLGCAGLLAGGRWCDAMLARGREDAPIRVAIVSCVGMSACFGVAGLVGLAGGGTAALALITIGFFWMALPIGVVSAALQMLVPNDFRALVSSAYLFTISIIGLGLGPLLPPLLNGARGGGPNQIYDALTTVAMLLPIGAAVILFLGRGAYVSAHAAARDVA